MGKLGFEIIESDFNKKLSSTYHLSILVRVDSLVYLVYDFEQNVLVLKEYNYTIYNYTPKKFLENVRSIYQSDFLLSLLYRKVKILFDSSAFTLIPSRLYNEKEKESYFEQLVSVTENSTFLADELKDIKAHLLYPIDQNLYSASKVQFPTAKIGHAVSELISGCKSLITSQGDFSTFVNVQDKRMQICVFEREKLLFVNSFPFETSKDALYYLLLIFDQFKLKPELSPIFLSGQIRENSEIYHLFYRYVKNINFCSTPSNLTIGKQLDREHLHQYLDIFSTTLST